MKQKVTLMILLLFTVSSLTGCFLQSTEDKLRERAENYLDFSLPENATVENENDSLPVIPDGYDYFKIDIPTGDEAFLQNISNWSELPYKPDEQLFFFGSEDEYYADHYEVGALPDDGNLYSTGEDGHVYRKGKDGFFDDFAKRNEKVIPDNIVNGKYSLTEYDKSTDGYLLSFKLCVYDRDASALYIFYFDS